MTSVGLSRGLVFLWMILAATPVAFADEPTPYQEMNRGYGVDAEPVQGSDWLIIVGVNADTHRDLTSAYVQLRAAELALEEGYPHFLITNYSRSTGRRSGSAGCGSRGRGSVSSCGSRGAVATRNGRGNRRVSRRDIRVTRARLRTYTFEITLVEEPSEQTFDAAMLDVEIRRELNLIDNSD